MTADHLCLIRQLSEHRRSPNPNPNPNPNPSHNLNLNPNPNPNRSSAVISDGVKDMTHEAKAKAKAKAMTHKAKAKDLTCHAALKLQTLYTVQ